MTTQDVLRELRRRIGEALFTVGIDPLPDHNVAELMEYVAGACLYLDITGIGDETYTVTVSPPEITPEPSSIDGVLIAAKASADLLGGSLIKKISNGDLGIRFKTGLEEISTIEAGKKILEQSRELDRWFNQIKTLKLSKRTSGVIRVQ